MLSGGDQTTFDWLIVVKPKIFFLQYLNLEEAKDVQTYFARALIKKSLFNCCSGHSCFDTIWFYLLNANK